MCFSFQDFLAKCERIASEHRDYQGSHEEFTQWLTDAKATLCAITDGAKDQDSLESRKDKIHVSILLLILPIYVWVFFTESKL